ncbi:MAG TPA: hypothetical protein VFQ53_25145 [Kofleriaceae bacterium]|nr:hypothetical protein [Kofleriaceae bacterium]
MRDALGEPTRPLDTCAICRAIPASCRRFVKGGDVETDTIPPEVEQLVPFLQIAGARATFPRCPGCGRIYRYDYEYEFIYGGSEDTYHYDRLELRQLLHHEDIVPLRLEDGELVRSGTTWVMRANTRGDAGALVGPQLAAIAPGPLRTRWVERWEFFARHCVAEIDLGARTLHVALDDDGHVTVLTDHLDHLVQIAAADPPAGLDDLERARRYAQYADRVTEPSELRRIEWFGAIRWRATLTDDERHYIEELRQLSRIDREVVEQLADRVLVKTWGIADRALVHRVLTVFPTGEVRREDAVIGHDLPIAER